MANEQSAKNTSAVPDIKEALAGANICVIGSFEAGRSVLKSLKKAGASKAVLLTVDEHDNVTFRESINRHNAILGQEDVPIVLEWTLSNIENYVSQADLIIDVLSDWQKKLMLSDICMELGKILIHGGISGFRFQIYTMIPGRSACLRCALPLAGIDEVRSKSTEEPSLTAVTELMDAWQSLEAIKYLAKIGIIQGNELFKFDCLSGEFDVIRGLDANLDCPDCGRKLKKRKRL